MMFIGDANGGRSVKSDISKNSSQIPTSTTLSQPGSTKTPNSKTLGDSNFKNNAMKISIIHHAKSKGPSRCIRFTVDKPFRSLQILEGIKFPMKHRDTSEVNLGVTGLYFYSQKHATRIFETLSGLEIVTSINYLKNPSSFEHCDYALFNNSNNLTEVNILRFLEMIDKVLLLKKLSPKHFLVKFDSILIQKNIQRVKIEHFWQFDQRYYRSLVCFTDANYDLMYTSMTNPLRLKFCIMVDRQKYRGLGTKIDFQMIQNKKDTRTTIMIKNIPNRLQKKDLIGLFNEHFFGGYDFIYLPIDYQV